VDGLHERYERELANDLGNLLSRTTAMIARYRGGELATAEGSPELAAAIAAAADAVSSRIDAFDLTGALDATWELVRELNRHVERTKPWELAREDGGGVELDRVLYDLADGLRAVAVALAAYLPETAPRILAALGQPADLAWENVRPGLARAASGIEPASPLFPRIDRAAAAA
jgi:methionyl-tRNA synthetase